MTHLDYIYRVKQVEKVTDGDTYWLHLDVGFRQMQLTEIRLAQFDTPEKNRGSDFEKSEAQRARSVAEEFLLDSYNLYVQTEKDPDDFGRWLGAVWREGEGGVRVYLGEILRDYGLASQWPTRWREEFDSA